MVNFRFPDKLFLSRRQGSRTKRGETDNQILGGQRKVKGWLTGRRLLKGSIGLMMIGLVLLAPLAPADAAQCLVRFNIPACMS
ncbi:hypothetical membrane protein [Syntrophus aciditrophicus SB]|uniref:Hypothetical membrane protein n=1 Tax=Syntrophus aciditrophicus (strain SB) TaxID=56780 RepID=Q2LSE0_SYNAS|nr:hypothetical membrane protein [Syntrophus aciditrophicus SB]